jgi:predicted TIM-barrel fold metal-dependent hydrolase
MAQLYLLPEAAAPFGQPQFRPVLEAAVRAGLPVALHVHRAPGMRLLMPVGIPSYHLEIFPQWPLHFMSHLASFVFEGVFDDLPDLRVVCVEGGFTWVAPFSWRLDRYWEDLGRELTGARRRPSELIKEHVRFTTQPVEEPTPTSKLLSLMEWIEPERTLMFSSDYPHYDYDDPAWIVPRLPERIRERVLAQTAIELYGLPATRPYDELDRAAGVADPAAPDPART